MNEETKKVKIVYTNYKNETATRTIIPKEIKYGKTEYHLEEQWLLVAWDFEKQAERTFAMKDVKEWKV